MEKNKLPSSMKDVYEILFGEEYTPHEIEIISLFDNRTKQIEALRKLMYCADALNGEEGWNNSEGDDDGYWIYWDGATNNLTIHKKVCNTAILGNVLFKSIELAEQACICLGCGDSDMGEEIIKISLGVF